MKFNTEIIMNKFKIFHQLHNDILLLPNAWDPLSALLLEQAGFAAIATTSWGMAQARGQQDGEQCSFAEFLNQLKPIVNAVSIPISVDIESGYSNDINTICQHVLAVAKLGAVGINIEDSDIKTGKLRTQKQQIAILSAIKETLNKHGFSQLFINARTDCFLQTAKIGPTITRSLAYQAAGIDGVFVPGLTDSAAIKQLKTALSVPLNIMADDLATDSNSLFTQGVQRFSLGNSLFDATKHFILTVSCTFNNAKNCDHLFQ
ncbi:hypothetical protein CWB85_02160 [Pseudoalteromonas sp. S1727]|nr:hypothetical protein CWB85_02160 [Pseudoalteromonas sp. S1727]